MAKSREIIREQLLERIDEASAHASVSLIAAGGYGKTTLLNQHAAKTEREGKSFAWVTLDEAIVPYVVEEILSALDVRHPASFATTGSAIAAARFVLRAIEKRHDSFTLYVDEAHQAATVELEHFLDHLVAHRPPSLHLIMAGRQRAISNSAKLIVSGGLVEFTGADLRFGEDEISKLLPLASISDELQDAIGYLDGWPLGIGFARLVAEDAGYELPVRPADAALLAEKAMGQLSDYFSEQVLRRLSTPQRTFLVQLSIVDAIDAGIATALTGYSDAESELRQIADLNLFVEPVNPTTFRFQSAFRRHLQRHLDPGQLTELHRVASRWYCDRGDYGRALRHASAGGSLELASAAVAKAGGWRHSITNGTALWRSFADLSDETIAPDCNLLMARTHLCLHQGEILRARHLLEHAERAARAADDSDELIQDTRCLDLLVALFEEWPAAVDRLPRYHGWIETDFGDDNARSIELELIGWTAYSAGRFDLAASASKKSREVATAYGHDFIQVYGALAHSVVLTVQGYPVDAETAILEAVDTAERLLGSHSTTTCAARIFQAAMLLDRGNVSGARKLFRPALENMLDGEIWPEAGYQLGYLEVWLSKIAGDGRPVRESIAALSSSFSMRPLDRVQQRIAYEIELVEQTMRPRAIEFRPGSPQPHCDDVPANALELDWQISLPALELNAWQSLVGNDLEAAQGHCARIREFSEQTGSRRHLPAATLLEALCLARAGRIAKAAAKLDDAVDLSHELKYVLPLFRYSRPLNDLTAADNGPGDNAKWQVAIQRVRNAVSELENDAGEKPGSRAPTPECLSPRETQVFQMIADGYTSKEMARELDISLNTVLGYRRSVYEKLGLRRRSALVELARSLR